MVAAWVLTVSHVSFATKMEFPGVGISPSAVHCSNWTRWTNVFSVATANRFATVEMALKAPVSAYVIKKSLSPYLRDNQSSIFRVRGCVLLLFYE